MSFPFSYILNPNFLTNSHFRIERSKQHINRAIGSTQTPVPLARCAWIDRYGRTWRSTDTPTLFLIFFNTCFVSHVKRYTCTLISSLHRLWLTRTKAHRAAEALVNESSDTSGTLSGAKRSGNAFTAEQKRSDHTCEYFFPKNLFVGGKFASEIFKLVLKRYAIKTHVKHTHPAYAREEKRKREI